MSTGHCWNEERQEFYNLNNFGENEYLCSGCYEKIKKEDIIYKEDKMHCVECGKAFYLDTNSEDASFILCDVCLIKFDFDKLLEYIGCSFITSFGFNSKQEIRDLFKIIRPT